MYSKSSHGLPQVKQQRLYDYTPNYTIVPRYRKVTYSRKVVIADHDTATIQTITMNDNALW